MRLIATLCILFFFTDAISQTAAESISWYKCMKGTIGKYPVSMHLHKWNHEYGGYYYYESAQEPMHFSGHSNGKDSLRLSAYPTGEDTEEEIFSGIIKDSSFEGVWYKPGKTMPLPFSFKFSTNPLIPNFTYV